MNPASEAERAPDDAYPGASLPTDPRVCRRAYDDVLRDTFSEAAHAVTPSPAPLAAIARAGRTRRRRGNAALVTAGCVLLLGPLGVVLVRGTTSPAPLPAPVLTAAPPRPSPAPRPVMRPARVVQPNQRVKAAPGAEVWLTEDGKHWSIPGQPGQFRSVSDGNLDTSVPGITYQAEPVGDRYFYSGIYYGTREAARVEIMTPTGEVVRAELLQLAGAPGWGVWYATVEPSLSGPEIVRGIVLYSATGKVLATL
ncbi:hypothetical protein [Streptomyces lushanensis]|uniref:hypothetical protein n=1 Tax=Streptomyces lushanensis TaxID=1434255 RepID=UPI000831FFF4|nr:hypothetical protein [Streptomyces lushanensis]